MATKYSQREENVTVNNPNFTEGCKKSEGRTKSEGRNPKAEGSPKSEIRNPKKAWLWADGR